MTKLILLRHGASIWNELNLFTGWVDIPLSQKGIEESLVAGRAIAHIPIEVIFVSSLIRTQQTAMLAMSLHQGGKVPYVVHSGQEKRDQWAQIYSEKAQEMSVPVLIAWELNERMYGELQGMNKEEMRKKYGDTQVHNWRRSFDQAPPGGENLKMTAERTVPYFKQNLIPYLEQGKNVFVCAHGNSLRSILMYLDQMKPEDIVHLEIPTGVPLIYTYNQGKWATST